jgi:uncharacterized protein YndB with AHSA1/START domain
MTQSKTEHATFVIERNYAASPARVFGAWAEPAAKARWFNGPGDWQNEGHELDFRVGGRERLRVGPVGGVPHTFECVYREIVPGERIIYCYDMYLGEKRISVSLATVEFAAAGSGTRMVFTEQSVFLDGSDAVESRERGTRDLLDKLEAALTGNARN